MGQVVTLTQHRALYNAIRMELKKRGIPNRVTLGDLFSIVELGTTSSLEFRILNTDQATLPGEKRLDQTDAFFALKQGFFVGKAVGNDQAAINLDLSAMIWESFPNPAVFAAAGEAQALQILFNGNLTIQIDDQLYFQKRSLRNYQKVDTAQRGLEVSTAATNPAYFQSEFCAKDQLQELIPSIQFSGRKTPTVRVDLSTSAAMGAPENEANYALLWHWGFYIPGGAGLGNIALP